MGKNERRMPRKPATKFPNLRKKLQKGKIQSRQAKKKVAVHGGDARARRSPLAVSLCDGLALLVVEASSGIA
jgi:hypothetical protein